MTDLGPELTRLMEQHLPVDMEPKFRRAICIKCSRPIESMFHCWHDDGGYLKEQHLCKECGAEYGLEAPKTLVVVAAYDHKFDDNVAKIEERAPAFIRMDTSRGGYPPWAYIKAFLQYPEYDSYLFLQDSMEPVEDDIVTPFTSVGTPVVAWATFPITVWDGDAQIAWVLRQYAPIGYQQGQELAIPDRGIFGPVFYATREALEKTEPFFPKYPHNRIEYQGTERAWAFAFLKAGVKVGHIGQWEVAGLEQGNVLGPFRKTFAGR